MLICDWSSDVCSSDLGPPSAGTRDRRGADIIVGGIGQDQRAPTGLGQASVIGTCHQSRKFERSGTIDLYGGGVGTGVDQGESAIRSGVGAADVGEGPILQNKVGGVRGGLADAACSPAIGNTSHLQPAAAARCGARNTGKQ